MKEAKENSKVALATQELSKSFGAMLAVHGVSLEIPEGEIRAIIGPNGAGKTTLFNLISGSLRSTSGRVFFFGEEITHLPVYQRARLGLGRTCQQTSVFPHLSVAQNLRLACMPKTIGKFGQTPLSVSTPKKYLEEFGLLEKGQSIVHELSYGEQRKLEIILGLALNSKVLLLDEPTAGLSPQETEEMIRLIGTIKGKATILLIEHDMDVVFGVADRITVLNFGEVIAEGSKEEIQANPFVQQAYFGTEGKP
jgi:branched-chain amino acid transport system ATP-binding protein